MANEQQPETGFRWWVRYVCVPIVVAGVGALLLVFVSRPEAQNPIPSKIPGPVAGGSDISGVNKTDPKHRTASSRELNIVLTNLRLHENEVCVDARPVDELLTLRAFVTEADARTKTLIYYPHSQQASQRSSGTWCFDGLRIGTDSHAQGNHVVVIALTNQKAEEALARYYADTERAGLERLPDGVMQTISLPITQGTRTPSSPRRY